MDYGFLVTAACLYAFMFFFNKKYQKNNGTGLEVALTFTFFTSIVSLLIFIILAVIGEVSGAEFFDNFTFEFSWVSLLITMISALGTIGFSIFSIKAFGVANLSVFSTFAMLGGMLLPSLYGLIFSNEPLTWGKVCCYILILVALCLTFEKGKQGKKAMLYCFAVFFLNGLSGVLTSIHRDLGESGVQIVNSGSYMMLSRVSSIVVCFTVLMVITKKLPQVKVKDLGNVIGNAASGGIGNLLQYVALLTLDSSVLFPIITGGTMLSSMAVSLITREKVKPKAIIAAVIAAASTVLMLF